MFKFTFSFFLFFLALSFLQAQTTLPYYTGFNDSSEQAAWTHYRVGQTTNPSYTWEFSLGELVHYYPVGGSEITDDWMVSPPFDFANGGTIDSLSYRFAGFGLPFGIDTIALYVLTDHPHPDTATSQTIIRLYTDSTYVNDNVMKKDTSIQIPAHAGTSYLAFRYKTTINWLDAFIDDIYIDGSSVSVEEDWLRQNVKIYPNPASDFVKIVLDPRVKLNALSITSLTGKSIDLEVNPNNVIDLSKMSPGTYFVRLDTNEGVYFKRLLIQ
ncbi:MAG: T9SS type A sorting domain-containing protein [Bacteroidia bacterium]